MTTQRQRPSSACSAARSASVLGPVPAYLPTRSSTPRGLTGRSTTRSPRSTITTRSASPCTRLRRNRDLPNDLTCILHDLEDRKSVVQGQSVYGRVKIGGPRVIKK